MGSFILYFFLVSLPIAFSNAISIHCPKKITLSSERAKTRTDPGDWQAALGRYSFKNYENGNAIYENDQLREMYLYKSRHGNWMVGSVLGKDLGWIANTKCKSECPNTCPEGSWIYWSTKGNEHTGYAGSKGFWKSDSTLTVNDSERMQSDHPQLNYEHKETYRAGHPHSTCSKVLPKSYLTFEEASTECSKDQQCSFILDQGCDDKGVYKLCSQKSLIPWSSTDCIFTIKF